MSGSTRLEGAGTWWRMVFETPRVSFVPPRPGEPSAEQRYHEEHRRAFEDVLARAGPPLDAWLAGIAERHGLVPIASGGEVVALAAPRVPHCMLFAVHARRPLPGVLRDRLGERAGRRIARWLRRCPDPDDATPFQIVRFADGTVEDVGGHPVGFEVPGDLPPDVAAEVVRRCAEIVAAAEAHGVVHADLMPDRVRLDDDGAVSVSGYGEEARPPRVAGARPEFYEASGESPPDWVEIQRRGLGGLARHLGVDAGDAPDPRALLARLPATDALDRLVAQRWEPSEVGRPRGGWRVDARLANGARGVLRPCEGCGQPTIVGSCMHVLVDGRARPTCRRCLDARSRRDGWIVRGVVAAVVLGALALVVGATCALLG